MIQIYKSTLIGCACLLVFNVAWAEELCKKACGEKDGLDYSICVVNNSVLAGLDGAIKDSPKLWIMFFTIAGILIFFFRRVDTTAVIEFFSKSPDKLVVPEKALDYMIGLWDRDLNSIIMAVVEIINIDGIDSQTNAKDRFENVLERHKLRTRNALSRMVPDELISKVDYEINEVYASWLSTLVNSWGLYRDKDTWYLIRQFRQAMNDQLGHYRKEVQRKILA